MTESQHDDVTIVVTRRMVMKRYLEHRVASATLAVGVSGVLGPVAVPWGEVVGEDGEDLEGGQDREDEEVIESGEE